MTIHEPASHPVWDIDLGDGLYMPADSGPCRWENEVVLRPFRPDDFELVYSWATTPDVSHTWRYRGTTPSPEMFAQHLWSGVLCQYVAVTVRDETPVGLATLYDANLSAQHAHMSCIVAAQFRRSGAPIGVALSIMGFGFQTWPLEKIYMEANSVALSQYRSAVDHGFFVEEARLRRYERFGDGWADLVHLSIDRAGFARFRQFFGHS